MSQDFKNGKIYKITNNINSEVYVGSTCDILRKRFNNHASYSKQDDKLNRPLYKMMNELGPDIFRIDLIENYSCNDKQELRQREGYWIRQIGTLNKVIAGRTIKEYRDENKEKINEAAKEYREKNIEIINEKKKVFRKNHTEEIKEYKSTPVTCICGVCVKKGNLWEHKKSKKHLAFLENNKTN